MTRSKKIFIVLSAVFMIALLAISYDISRRTTHPGARRLLRESLVPSADVQGADSVTVTDHQPR